MPLGESATLPDAKVRRSSVLARWPYVVLLLGALAYLVISTNRIAVFPPVGEDEPWIAAAPYKLATQGVLGSDLFTGYYGMERHHYQQMPLFPLAEAAVFKLFGAGVAQMRALPIAFGLVLLISVFAVGRQLGGDRVGALGVVLLLVMRVADGGDGTGILLLDRARINRYDIAVPVFGLLALWAFNRADRDRAPRWFVIAGLLTGLSSLSHLYGVFWLPIIVVLLCARRGRGIFSEGSLALLMGGFILPWLPWAAYVATGWSDYVGQLRLASARFDVFSAKFYLDNILHNDGPISLDWAWRTIRTTSFSRIGTWTMLLGCPAALATMAWSARRHGRSVVAALSLAALVQTVMFVALLKVKTMSYMIALWPVWALVLAWFGVWLWDRHRLAVRIGLVMLFVTLVAEGATRIAFAQRNAERTTPYDFYEGEVAACIPPGSLVLGLQHYWLGLRQFPYRTWLLPIDLSDSRYYHEPMSLDQALDRVNPSVILIDRYIRDLMTSAQASDDPNHRLYVGFEAFKARRHAELVCDIPDHTYGSMQVYLVR